MGIVSRAAGLVAFVTAAGAAAALLAPAPATASPAIRYGIKDDAWLMYGPGTLAQRLRALKKTGVQVVRFGLRWDRIATWRPKKPRDPDDPAYAWDGYDRVLRGLRAQHIEAIVGIWGTPLWANRGRGPEYAPTSGRRFAEFAEAAARRYPWVRRWLIWNEPNQLRWLRPTSAATYVRKLLDPAYAAIHRVDRHALVGGGVSAPRGGRGGVSPVAWISGLKKAHAKLDAYAHNPYPLAPRRETPLEGGCTRCATLTMATLPRLLRLVRRSFGPVRVWLTEYGYQTRPPERFLGVSPAQQSRYLGQAAMRAYLAPRVDVLIHFLYRDEPDGGGFQSGLRWASNRPKPALRAFELPLAERARRGSHVALWGQVRLPGVRGYRLQVHSRGHWRNLTRTRRASKRGYFTWQGRLARGRLVRVVADRVASPPLRLG
jgi:hypothetical protein